MKRALIKGFSFRRWSQTRNWHKALIKGMVGTCLHMLHEGILVGIERGNVERAASLLENTLAFWNDNNNASRSKYYCEAKQSGRRD